MGEESMTPPMMPLGDRLECLELARKALMKEATGKRLTMHERKWIANAAVHVNIQLIPLHNPGTGRARGYMFKLISEGWDRKTDV
jgi:hypothetical protein